MLIALCPVSSCIIKIEGIDPPFCSFPPLPTATRRKKNENCARCHFSRFETELRSSPFSKSVIGQRLSPTCRHTEKIVVSAIVAVKITQREKKSFSKKNDAQDTERNERTQQPHNNVTHMSTEVEHTVGEKYVLGRKIGSGAFGEIFIGKLRHEKNMSKRRARSKENNFQVIAVITLSSSTFTIIIIIIKDNVQHKKKEEKNTTLSKSTKNCFQPKKNLNQ